MGVEKLRYSWIPAQKELFDTPGIPVLDTVEKVILVLATGVRGNVRTTIEVTTPNVPALYVNINALRNGR
jgi:hypothetical protein